MKPATFSKSFDIEEAIGWELYKSNLAEELLERAAHDPGCPVEITGSAYIGEVTVDGGRFVITLTEGEPC